ncbi:MAG: sensor histidine kinase [Hyphomicrobiales bacterium]|nr:sensor histidine kinase [Hyphomicrobiales bacterium]
MNGVSPLVTELGQLPRLSERLDTLVHESAGACPLTRARHAAFIRLHLLKPLCASIAAPLVLAIAGVPAPWQAAAFGLAMLPLAGVALASQRGALAEAQAIGLAALAGLACIAALASGPGFAAGLFLCLMPFEAALAGSPRALKTACIAAASLGALLLATSAAGVLPQAGASPLADAALGACAIAYGLGLAHVWRSEMLMREAMHGRERAEHALLRALVSDVALQFDRAGIVLSVTGDCAQALGLRPRELSGRGLFERVQVADRPVFLKALSDAARLKDGATVRLRLRGPDVGSARGAFAEPAFRNVEIRMQHLSGEGEAAVLSALMRDVTDLVAAERIVSSPPVVVREDSDWKSRLLANVSHELRTPLNAIIGFAQLLGGERAAPSDAQRREYADIIHASGQHLLSIVNALLDMSKMDAGRFQIAAAPLDLPQLIDTCCDIVRLKAQEAQVDIQRDVTANLGLVADERACRQIVLNLLSNAIKFTPKGGRVTLQARNDGGHLVLSVADTGIGVSLADLPRLGDPFFQAHADHHAPHEGTGLGLSVVKGLVGLHGGSISVESAPGQGTCVTIRLPSDGHAPQKRAPESATIEIIPRRAAAPVHDVTMVKKIA